MCKTATLKKTKQVFQDQLLLNAGQKYCRMLQREHSAILSYFIKPPDFKVREKSGNFEFSQGNLNFWQKAGKSQGILESEVEGGETRLYEDDKVAMAAY